MSSHVHLFDAREGGSFRISLTYDDPTGTGKTTEHTDTYHGRFVKLVPNEQVVEMMAFETADATMRGEMTVTFTDAHYAALVDRYCHFALGQPHEYARLTATTDAGRKLVFQLPENEVFEDLALRIVRLAPAEPQEMLTIVSRRGSGSRLMMIRLRGDHLETSAQSPAIGTPMR